MWTLWFYRFKPGLTASTLDALRLRGVEKLYPGGNPDRGTFLGRVWGHLHYTHVSVLRREGLDGVRAEAQDLDNLVRNLRILSPALAGMEVRNMIPRHDTELAELGDDGWHARAVQPWIDAARQNAEVAYHLNVIGVSCMKQDTVPPYMIQAVWRDRLGYGQQWIGGRDPRRHWPPELQTNGDRGN